MLLYEIVLVFEVLVAPITYKMTRGNQRDLARQKNMKKNQEHTKSKKADDKDGNKGTSLQERKQRDADRMREKQKASEDKK